MTGDEIGAVIDSGLVDWQIVQQNEHGYGTIALHGRWFGDAMLPGTGAVQVRVLLEATGAPLSRVLDWASVKTTDDGAWEPGRHGLTFPQAVSTASKHATSRQGCPPLSGPRAAMCAISWASVIFGSLLARATQPVTGGGRLRIHPR